MNTKPYIIEWRYPKSPLKSMRKWFVCSEHRNSESREKMLNALKKSEKGRDVEFRLVDLPG